MQKYVLLISVRAIESYGSDVLLQEGHLFYCCIGNEYITQYECITMSYHTALYRVCKEIQLNHRGAFTPSSRKLIF